MERLWDCSRSMTQMLILHRQKLKSPSLQIIRTSLLNCSLHIFKWNFTGGKKMKASIICWWILHLVIHFMRTKQRIEAMCLVTWAKRPDPKIQECPNLSSGSNWKWVDLFIHLPLHRVSYNEVQISKSEIWSIPLLFSDNPLDFKWVFLGLFAIIWI